MTIQIPLEALAHFLLSSAPIKEKIGNSLFIRNGVVLVFDGLVVFRGSLNMFEAIPRLQILSKIVRLPVAVIEHEDIGKANARREKLGRHLGPGNWAKNTWSSEEGFDSDTLKNYTESGIAIEKTIIKASSAYNPRPTEAEALFFQEGDIINSRTSMLAYQRSIEEGYLGE